MHIKYLSLEITRKCNLKCEHCLRGDSRNESMSNQTISNVFKDVKEIDQILLSGGEPLLAIDQIRDVIIAIKENGILVHDIAIVTNCTLFNEEILQILNEISEMTHLTLALSDDIFHYLEVKRLGLVEQRMENSRMYQEIFEGFELYTYGNEDVVKIGDYNYSIILPVGRAKNLTPERLAEINSMVDEFDYILFDTRSYRSNDDDHRLEYDEKSDTVSGITNIDVYGNVTGLNMSYDEETEEALQSDSNINERGLLKAILNYKKFASGDSSVLKKVIKEEI